MSEKDLIRIVLPDAQPLPSPYAEADRRQAVEDLLAGNSFRPNGLAGPFGLAIMVRDGRLILDIRDAEDKALHALVLALGPFRRLIKDYHLVVESHEKAVAEGGSEARIQAIDMGRRGLHNEGATLGWMMKLGFTGAEHGGAEYGQGGDGGVPPRGR